jgi:hypothetical protein
MMITTAIAAIIASAAHLSTFETAVAAVVTFAAMLVVGTIAGRRRDARIEAERVARNRGE